MTTPKLDSTTGSLTARRATSRRRVLVPSGCRQQVLAENDRSQVRRLWLPDGSTVIWKESIGEGSVARRRHETEVLDRLDGVPGVARLAEYSHPDAVVLADDGGMPLAAAAVEEEPFEPAAVAALAVALSRTIAAMHARGVVHKDINPANILLNDARQPVLIDFDVANTFAEDRPGFVSLREIVGTLLYLPPEQTGRTGLPVDHRADLYTLGSTLYELLAGRPPFQQDDELSLIHDILLKVPTPLAELRADVPPMLSQIVARLLEKEPGRRYQSAEGLAHDLSRVVQQPDELFPLGEWDFPLRLAAPSRLVGRHDETAVLHTALERAIAGATRAVLVAGAPGVGKSALINELRRPAAAAGGWYVTGKSDQYQHETALGSVLQAVRGVGRLLLAEPKEVLTPLRNRLAEVLATNMGLITTALPEFAMLLSDGHPAFEDYPAEAEPRLRRALVELLRVVVTPQRPLVLVVDDLQWADPTSLGLFDALLTEPGLPGLLVVGAYRAQEVDAAHPLSAMAARWQRLGVVSEPMSLENLPPGDSAILLEDMLRLPAGRAAELAGALHRWTHGNPYDTLELINALRRDCVLALVQRDWQWDVAAIREHVGQSDVVGILQARIARLPESSRTLMQVMACLGGEPDVRLLAHAVGRPVTAVIEQLTPSLEDGLLVMANGRRIDAAVDGVQVRFRHDRVQQAVSVGLDDPARTLLRLTVARRLAGSSDTAVPAAEQYLGAADAVHDPSELRAVVGLFTTAADHAWRVGNHLTAERFLTTSTKILAGLDAPDDDPRLISLRIRRHAALYALGRLDEADDVYAAIERGNPNPVHLSVPANTQLNSMAQRMRHHEALRFGLELLERLGQPVPGEQFAQQLPAQCRELAAWADTLDLTADLVRPETTDERVLAVTCLFSRLLPTAFQLHERLIGAWILLESRRLWDRHGPSAMLAATLPTVGPLLAAILGDYRTGGRIGRHVLAVSEARNYEPFTSLLRHRYSMQLMPWMEPLENSVEQARQAHEGLVRGGDLQMASATSFTVLAGQLDCARSLESYVGEIESAAAFDARTGNRYSGRVTVAHRQLARALLGRTAAPGLFDDQGFSEREHLSQVDKHPLAAGNYHTFRSVAAAIFGDAAALEKHTAAVMPLRAAVIGYAQALIPLVRALSLAEQLRREPRPDPERLLAELDECRDWLAARAEDAPVNFRHLVGLVDAERAWATGDELAALAAFDRGNREAEAVQRPWHRALLAEHMALFHLAHGFDWAGRGLLAEARQAYLDWGATGKVLQLDAAYPFLRVAGRARIANSRNGSMLPRTSSISADAIDTMGILRASQALSSATSLDGLQVAIVEQLTTLTGAADVVLAVRDDDAGDWYLPASPHTGPTVDVETAGQRGLLPLTAFHYAARTREPLLVEDATRDDRFHRDPYLTGAQRCSLLVVPVLHHDEIRAMLVLSNKHTSGVFTTDRLDAVVLIAGQLVVSLNNALLYASLEHRVDERTRELAAANRQLEILSATDALTGLANRRQFERAIDAEWRRATRTGQPFSVVMIDVDFFKKYNDHYGHQAGDHCLRQIGDVLAASVRGATDLACRYGGEEFVLVLGETGPDGAATTAERTRSAVEALRLPHVAGVDGHVSISIGVATSPGGPLAEIAEELLARADTALYRAKEEGRNQVRCAPSAEALTTNPER
ncbi:diguanylate cyclase [Actinoplanes solisilvae]|uniref:diguanylate cyclase n=1 Tax=Actinoplanes solisilvae TaxID=2486853 RepID=UPI000FD7F969|nr:diguanylate cyclase [Actinoplanes solisilvae]